MQQKSKKVIVVGGGPAGIMAAATSAYNGNETVLVEKNENHDRLYQLFFDLA